VGLIPLFAVTTLDAESIDKLHGFKRRNGLVHQTSAGLVRHIASITRRGVASGNYFRWFIHHDCGEF